MLEHARGQHNERMHPGPPLTVGPPSGSGPGGGAPGRTTVAGVVAAVARAPFTVRALAEAPYCLAGFPLGVAGFVLVVVALALGTGLTLSLVAAVLGLLVVVA